MPKAFPKEFRDGAVDWIEEIANLEWAEAT